MKAASLLLSGILLGALLAPPSVQGSSVRAWLCKVCSGGKSYPNPLFPEQDDAQFAQLRDEIEALNATFYPTGRLAWCYTAPKHLNKPLIALDERVMRLNAQIILRERDPKKIRRDIERLYRDLHHLFCTKKRPPWSRAPCLVIPRTIKTSPFPSFE